jgi:hypothetical protein
MRKILFASLACFALPAYFFNRNNFNAARKSSGSGASNKFEIHVGK